MSIIIGLIFLWNSFFFSLSLVFFIDLFILAFFGVLVIKMLPNYTNTQLEIALRLNSALVNQFTLYVCCLSPQHFAIIVIGAFLPPPQKKKKKTGGLGGGGILESLCPSVVLSVCPTMSAQCHLNRAIIFYQTCYGGVLLWDDVSCGEKKWFTIFNVKVTARAYIIKKIDYFFKNYIF